MKLFLIRHAKSNEHELSSRQTPHSQLGDFGKNQANVLGQRLTSENIDLIITSKWPRAFQTAQIISEKTAKPYQEFDAIHEIEHHPDLNGIALDHDLNKRFKKEIQANLHNLDWKFDGKGESFRDVMHRANNFQKSIIKSYPTHSVAVISHGIFIKIFIALTILGDQPDDKTLKRFVDSIVIENTGISLLEYFPENQQWQLNYLNDHLHLR